MLYRYYMMIETVVSLKLGSVCAKGGPCALDFGDVDEANRKVDEDDII